MDRSLRQAGYLISLWVSNVLAHPKKYILCQCVSTEVVSHKPLMLLIICFRRCKIDQDEGPVSDAVFDARQSRSIGEVRSMTI